MVCFLVFALIGLRSHEDGISAASFMRVAVPFQIAWLVFSWLLGLQGRNAKQAPRTIIQGWLPACIVGLAIRTLVFGRPFAIAFAIISFLANAGLLIGWRQLASRVLYRNDASEAG
jgi:hypothetical protein